MWHPGNKPIQPGNFSLARSAKYRAFQLNLTFQCCGQLKIITSKFLTTDLQECMFYIRVCHTITAHEWMILSFNVMFSVSLMVFICDYNGILTP
jgi:hypothetical protein